MNVEAEILQDLAAPLPSFRLIGIEKAIQQGKSHALLDGLENHLRLEDNEECRILLNYAIVAVRERLGQGAEPAESRSAEEWLQAFDRSDSSGRMRLLAGLDKREKAGIARLTSGRLGTETDPSVASFFIKTFQNQFSEEQIEHLSPFLLSPSMSLRLAALEAMVARAPDRLTEFLPRLLVSEDIRTRTLALRGMAAIDMDEAVKYLDILLQEGRDFEKEAALNLCILLPFEKVRDPLVKFLALEKHLPLVEKAGLLFQSNPDPDVPMLIWEITERSEPLKAGVLKAIIQGACQNLRLSGVMKEEFPVFIARLQAEFRRRAARRFVQETLEAIGESDEGSPAALCERVRSALERPGIRKAFEEALEWPLSEIQKTRLREIVYGVPGIPDAGKPAIAGKPFPSPEEFDRLSPEEQMRQVTTWPEQHQEPLQKILAARLRNPGLSPDVHATCLRAALRISLAGFSAESRKWVRHANPNLASAAIEYLGAFDPDVLIPQMGLYLKSTVARVKASALKTLKRIDPHQAVSSLKALLGSPDPEQKKLALSCMIHFDFFLVRSALVEFLATDPEPPLLEAGLCFFQANPDPENLYALFTLEKNGLPPNASTFLAHRKILEKALIAEGKLAADSLPTRETEMEQRRQAERAKKQAPSAAYSLQAIPKAHFLGHSQEAVQKAIGWAQAAAVLLLVIVLSSGFHFFLTPDAEPSRLGNNEGALTAVPVTLPGTITEIRAEADQILFQADDGTRFVLLLTAPIIGDFAPGDRVKISLAPFRIGPDGVVIAHLQSLTKN